MFNSDKYWETRYKDGGNSGKGSYGKLAQFKVDVINPYIKDKTVIELGCGDGNQLSLFKDYKKYIGFDVSETIISTCKDRFSSSKKTYFYTNSKKKISTYNQKVDVAMSLDVLYHLVEDSVYETYIKDLFELKADTVIIYGKNFEPKEKYASHVKPRKFTQYIKDNFFDYKLINHVPQRHFSKNHMKGSDADFFIYQLVK